MYLVSSGKDSLTGSSKDCAIREGKSRLSMARTSFRLLQASEKLRIPTLLWFSNSKLNRPKRPEQLKWTIDRMEGAGTAKWQAQKIHITSSTESITPESSVEEIFKCLSKGPKSLYDVERKAWIDWPETSAQGKENEIAVYLNTILGRVRCFLYGTKEGQKDRIFSAEHAGRPIEDGRIWRNKGLALVHRKCRSGFSWKDMRGLAEIKATENYAETIRDLYKLGFYHRDISYSNLIIAVDDDTSLRTGFLIDLDCAIEISRMKSDEEELTGTIPFMPIEMLEKYIEALEKARDQLPATDTELEPIGGVVGHSDVVATNVRNDSRARLEDRTKRRVTSAAATSDRNPVQNSKTGDKSAEADPGVNGKHEDPEYNTVLDKSDSDHYTGGKRKQSNSSCNLISKKRPRQDLGSQSKQMCTSGTRANGSKN
ncbi:hypothetical protein ACEPAI_3028 [Sanghuangporus weigelae]